MSDAVDVRTPGWGTRFADAGGVAGAVVAALCCAGTPVIVGALGAVGLTFLRRDAVLYHSRPGSSSYTVHRR